MASQLLVQRDVPPAKAAPTNVTNLEQVKQQRAAMMKRLLTVSSASLGTSLAMSMVGASMLSPLGLLSTAGFVYGAAPVFTSAFKALQQEKKPNVDTLVAIISGVCLTQGYLVAGNLAVWFNAVRLILLAKVNDNTQKSIFDVYQLQPRTVWLLTADAVVEVPFASVRVDDIVVVGAGETIPVDGIIVGGIALIDQQILTGEAQPVEKEQGDQVFASTVVLMGTVQVRVEQTGMETTVARIAETLNQARNFKSALQLRAEAFADRTILPTLVLSALSVPLIGPMGALVILNAHFGYRLSVIGAISILNYLNLAGKQGVLIKDGRALDLLREVDTIVFDKTGTLTQEQPHIDRIHLCGAYGETDVLAYAAAAESRQSHPIARAIIEEAQQRGIAVPAVDEADYKVGFGLKVTQGDQLLRVGSRRFMEMEALAIPKTITAVQELCHQQGHSLILVAVDAEVIGALEIHATVRPEARAVLAQLRRHDLAEFYIISGDHTAPTQKLAHDLGIDHYFAETLPHQKAEIIERLQAEGKTVCYIGDGINDAVALQKAHVSISLRGASTIATDTAQIILMDESIRHLGALFNLGDDFTANMKINFASIIVPSVLGIGGAFFLHFGLIQSIVLNQVGFAAGVGNAMLPFLRQARQIEEEIAPTALSPARTAVSALLNGESAPPQSLAASLA
ncbi:MAG: heavy metal translocating P-type ATPase [Caldilineaceae bacterium]